MKEPIEGLFYTQFDDETWQEALNEHDVGFENIADAIDSVKYNDKPEHYVVKDHKGNTVFSGYAGSKNGAV